MYEKNRTSRGGSLLQSKKNIDWAVFLPMIGDGAFGEPLWATWSKHRQCGLVANALHRTLEYQELCTLCDLYQTHYFWLVKTAAVYTVDGKEIERFVGGAFMIAKAYPNGMSGIQIPHPPRKTAHSSGGGSLV